MSSFPTALATALAPAFALGFACLGQCVFILPAGSSNWDVNTWSSLSSLSSLRSSFSKRVSPAATPKPRDMVGISTARDMGGMLSTAVGGMLSTDRDMVVLSTARDTVRISIARDVVDILMNSSMFERLN